MGTKPAAEKKRKKKKGRPSLLDLQKRSLRLQKLEQQQQRRNPNPNPSPTPNPYLKFPNSAPARRVTRRDPDPDPDPSTLPREASEPDDDEEEAAGADEDEDLGSGIRRREKKLKLVLRLPHRSGDSSAASGSDSDAGIARRKRKLAAVDGGREKGDRRSVSKAMDSHQGEPSNCGPTTPLPDKKLLVFILDRLQKKDTYGVFSEPVDPEELPDYHEVIEHPMDFGTVRKKLNKGTYATLEQFEKDVYLISSNAMCYNAPDTIYYRQARSIEELAKKSFENLRQESDDNEPETKTVVRRGRPPNKNKRPVGRPPVERATSDFSSNTTLANAGDSTYWSNSTNDMSRKVFVGDNSASADISTRTSHGLRSTDTFGWLAEQKLERNEEYLGSTLKGSPAKYGKKHTIIDENRRNTYKQSRMAACAHEPPLLTTCNGDRKLLVPVGLQIEYAYARSLARFAANLGPIAWAIAAKKIERVLPPGSKFGPGWVGDSEAPRKSQPPLLSTSPCSLLLPKIVPCTTVSRGDKLPQKQEPASSGSVVEDGHVTTAHPQDSTSASNRPRPSMMEGPPLARGSICENGSSILSGSGGLGGGADAKQSCKAPFQPHQNSAGIQQAINGFNTTFSFSMPSQVGKMVRPARLPSPFSSDAQIAHARALDMVSRSNNSFTHQSHMNHRDTERAKLAGNSNAVASGSLLPDSGNDSLGPWRGVSLQQQSDSIPPDLNIGFQSPGSPSTGVVVDSQQPDLALQL